MILRLIFNNPLMRDLRRMRRTRKARRMRRAVQAELQRERRGKRSFKRPKLTCGNCRWSIKEILQLNTEEDKTAKVLRCFHTPPVGEHGRRPIVSKKDVGCSEHMSKRRGRVRAYRVRETGCDCDDCDCC